MRGRNDRANINARVPRRDGRRFSPAVLASLAAVFATSLIAVYAVFFPVLLSDTVNITDQPSLRTTVEDSLDPQEDPSAGQTASEDLGPLDAVSPASSVTDNLGLSESAQVSTSMFFQVTTTSILAISDSVSPGAQALDTVDVQDKTGLGTAVRDAILLLDSAARVLILYISDSIGVTDGTSTQTQEGEVDQEEERDGGGNGGGPDRTVYDESYFEDRPLSRLEVTNIELVDSEDRVMTRVLVGQNMDISIAMQNHQKSSQSYTLFIQITDQDNVAIAIIPATGVIKDGAAIKVDVPWTTSSPGSYEIQIVTCDGNLIPTIISESVARTLIVG